METKTNRSYIATMMVAVMCLIAIIFTGTYAFFKARVEGEGTPFDVMAGKIDLSISESKINATNLAPILDSTKDMNAQKNEFTVSRTSDSNLGACYSLYLEVDKIGTNLRNQYFKYELVYDGTSKISGDFSNLTYDENGKARIALLTNQSLSDTITSNSYVLRVWFSYDTVNDQTSLLQGTADSRTFNAHLLASGQSGVCK